MADKSRFVLSKDTGICLLECEAAFNNLSNKEKLYAHYIAQASWAGSLICLYQTSPESPGIFVLLIKLFRAQTPKELGESLKGCDCGLTDDEFQAFLMYCSGFFSNMGNYKSFGDTKFIPDLDQAKFECVIQKSSAYQSDPEGVRELWEKVKDPLYCLADRQQQLGLGDQGISTYFSGDCDKTDAEVAQLFMDAKNLSAYNTRLFKLSEAGNTVYEIRLASVHNEGSGTGDMSILGEHTFTPPGGSTEVKFRVTCGDYSPIMSLICDNLNMAKKYAANEHEENMLTCYVQSFNQGSIPAHKQGSRHWIKNKGPIIETYIGFIESYRDPHGVRGEFEGFVAMVNKEMSAKFGDLVAKAEHLLPLLPWGASYEKDSFLRPDFTSLDVLAFGSSGIPAGINIPNYDDIRQDEGFKNVSLGNVLSSGYKDTKITFLEEKDKELYSKLKAASFEVQVGLHELLGHGSGKLFTKGSDGKFNFDTDHVTNILTGEKIASWYEAGETWNSKFVSLSQPYEECRAECVGIYLCLSSEILQIFGHTGSEADDIIYINWLNMVRAGLLALEFYNPDKQSWGQAHMHARYVILRVLLEAGDGLVTVEKVMGEDGEPDLIIRLDRSKINTTGKEAIGKFLTKLQVYKATADVAAGSAMFNSYAAVNDDTEPHFLFLRDIVLKRKQPRKMFVQCNTSVEGEGVKLQGYSSDTAGLIQSQVHRFPPSLDNKLTQLWHNDLKFH